MVAFSKVAYVIKWQMKAQTKISLAEQIRQVCLKIQKDHKFVNQGMKAKIIQKASLKILN